MGGLLLGGRTRRLARFVDLIQGNGQARIRRECHKALRLLDARLNGSPFVLGDGRLAHFQLRSELRLRKTSRFSD